MIAHRTCCALRCSRPARTDLRSGLTALGIGIGVTAVVLLTSIGEGVQHYVLASSPSSAPTSFRSTPGVTRDLRRRQPAAGADQFAATADAGRRRGSEARAGYVVDRLHGRHSAGQRFEIEGQRPFARVTLVTAWVRPQHAGGLVAVRRRARRVPATGRPARTARARGTRQRKCATNSTATDNPLGDQGTRSAADRFRVIGVMEPKGTVLGFDLDDAGIHPGARVWRCSTAKAWSKSDVLYSTTTAPQPTRWRPASAAF